MVAEKVWTRGGWLGTLSCGEAEALWGSDSTVAQVKEES